MEALSSLDELLAFELEWWELWSSDPRATPFQSPAWLIPWMRRLWGGGEIRSFVTRRDRAITGFAPLFLWGFGGDAVRVSFLGSGVSDYLDVLSIPEAGDCVAREIVEALLEKRDWDECDLQELRAESPIAKAAGFLACAPEPCSICPVLALSRRMDDLLATLDQKFRTDLRRAENRLRSQGALEFVSAAEPATAGALTERLIQLHSGRWRLRGEAGVLGSDGLVEFHREVVQSFLKRGILRLHGLKLDGEVIAVQYNFAAKGSTYAYLSGFEPAWSRHSPGGVLLKHSIEAAIAEGSNCFDFLRKEEAFKYQWGATGRQNVRLRFSRPPRAERPA